MSEKIFCQICQLNGKYVSFPKILILKVILISGRSSHPKVFVKKLFLQNSQNSQYNTCARVFF